MLNSNRWTFKILASLIGVVSIAAAQPVEARPVVVRQSRYYQQRGRVHVRPVIIRQPRYIRQVRGPVPYRGPVITHTPVGSTIGLPRHRPSRRYYRESFPSERAIRSQRTIRNSTLVNPTIVNSEIDDSVLINPVIINSRSHRRSFERRYYRQYSVPSRGIHIQFGN